MPIQRSGSYADRFAGSLFGGGDASLFAVAFVPSGGDVQDGSRLDLLSSQAYTYPSDIADTMAGVFAGQQYGTVDVYFDENTGAFRLIGTGAGSEYGLPFNPAGQWNYRLTKPDGTQYVYNSANGQLMSVTDPNGNTLTLGADIVAKNALNQETARLKIVREDGLIRSIQSVDSNGSPTGPAVEYFYDANGDLTSVEDRTDRLTKYAYGETVDSVDAPDHYLTSIKNHLDALVMQIGVGADGTLGVIKDASGASASFTYTTEGGLSVETVGDAAGKITRVARDAEGNVVRSAQQTGTDTFLVSVFEYDADGNQTKVYQPFTESFANWLRPTTSSDAVQSEATYDDFGRPKTVTSAGGTTTYDYDASGNPTVITDPLGRKTVNTYEQGRLKTTTDANGNTTEYSYDASGNLTSLVQVDDAGHRITSSSFTYDAQGHLLSSTDADPDGTGPKTPVTRYFAYDDAGNQTHSWYVKNNKTVVSVTVYDAEGRVTATQQFTLSAAYTGSDTDRAALFLALSTADDDWSTATAYDAVGRAAVSIDRFGHATHTLYDSRGNVIETRSQSVDEENEPVWVVSRTAYDDNGRAIATTDPYVVTNAQAPYTVNGSTATINISFNPDSDVLAKPVSYLRLTRTVYDDMGRVTATERYAALAIELDDDDRDQVVEPSDTDGIFNAFGPSATDYANAQINGDLLTRNTTVYDSAGRVEHTINHNLVDDPNDDARTDYYYDPFGRQVAVLGPKVTVIGPNGAEQVRSLTEYAYNALGQQESVTTAVAITDVVTGHPDITNASIRDESALQTTSFIYDKLGRVERTTYDDGTFTTTTYDNLGRRASETDALGRTTEFGYDDAGRLETVILPAVSDAEAGGAMVSPVYHYGYDAFGNQTSITDPKGRETTFTFDELNRQIGRQLPLGQTESTSYYGVNEIGGDFGLIKQSVDFEGRTVTYTYDEFGRLKTKAYSDGVGTRTVTYTYDGLSRVVETDDDGHGVTTNTYDAEGRLTQVVSPEGTLNYEYDDLGRLRHTYTGTKSPSPVSDPGYTPAASDTIAQTHTEYDYDVLGRLVRVTVHERNDTPLTTPEETEYTYDTVGNLDTQKNPDGVVVDHEYDSLNRLKMIVHFRDADSDKVLDAGESKVAQFDYTLDAAGNRVAATEKFDADNTAGTGTDGLEKEQTFNWKYDALNRLIQESFDTAGSADDYVVQYTFDLASNRKTKSVDNGSNGSVDETTSYTYDANDRLQQELLDTDGLAGAERTTTYAYNNTVQTGKTVTGDVTETHTYSYDVMGRMETATVVKGVPGSETTTTSIYVYNADGIRVEQRVSENSGPEMVTKYHYDANNHTGYAQVLEEKDVSDNVTKTYTIGHDVLAQQVAAVAAGAVLRFLYDGHGSTRALVTGTAASAGILNDTAGGNGLQLFTYDAYGNLVGFTGNALTTLLYSGELTDATTGLQYLRARYYDAATGRFTRSDPWSGSVADPVSLHKYLYANSNPIIRIDPTGEFSYIEVLGAGAGSAALGAIITRAIQVAVYVAIDKLLLDPIRKNSILIHVRDATLLRLAQTYNGGTLRASTSPRVYFTPVSIPVIDLVALANTIFFQGAKSVAIKAGVLGPFTQVAIDSFIQSLGLSKAAVALTNPSLVKPSGDVAVITTASTTSKLAALYGGGIDVEFEAGPLSRIFIKSLVTMPGEVVPGSRYKYKIV